MSFWFFFWGGERGQKKKTIYFSSILAFSFATVNVGKGKNELKSSEFEREKIFFTTIGPIFYSFTFVRIEGRVVFVVVMIYI